MNRRQFVSAAAAGVAIFARVPNVLAAAYDRLSKWYSPNGKFTRANVDQTQKISVDMKIMPQAYPYDDVVAPMSALDDAVLHVDDEEGGVRPVLECGHGLP